MTPDMLLHISGQHAIYYCHEPHCLCYAVYGNEGGCPLWFHSATLVTVDIVHSHDSNQDARPGRNVGSCLLALETTPPIRCYGSSNACYIHGSGFLSDVAVVIFAKVPQTRRSRSCDHAIATASMGLLSSGGFGRGTADRVGAQVASNSFHDITAGSNMADPVPDCAFRSCMLGREVS
nr:hypothetical protein CFP56_23946 [Quercus suber]